MSKLEVRLRHRLRAFDLDVSLSVGRETLAVIGVSGAGKSSLLLATAGLLTPDHGRITAGGRLLLDTERHVDLQPEERRVGLVFQHGALFPHLTVEQNVGYGLGRGSGDRRVRREHVRTILERYAILALASSKPDRISGGERQRVAIARAVATAPDVLLLDEPLSALDAVTKRHVTDELSRVLADLRLPTILVSHDLGDVAGLADRVAVMDAGKIVQIGTTAELLRAPASAFVATFVGTNFFPGVARRLEQGTEVELDAGGRVFSAEHGEGRVGVIVPPWQVSLTIPGATEPSANSLTGPVTSVAPRGDSLRVTIGSQPPIAAEIAADAAVSARLAPGVIVTAEFSPDRTRLLPGPERAAPEAAVPGSQTL